MCALFLAFFLGVSAGWQGGDHLDRSRTAPPRKPSRSESQWRQLTLQIPAAERSDRFSRNGWPATQDAGARHLCGSLDSALTAMYFDRLLLARLEVKYFLEKVYRRPCRPILNIKWREFMPDRPRRRAQKLAGAPSEKALPYADATGPMHPQSMSA